MSDYNTINQQLSELVAAKTKLDANLIKPDLNLEASGLDSFARIELILVIEEKFGIELSDSESANIATIDDLIKIIAEKTG
ncbi:MAG: acyl carrier protein [Gammaproteobacteria bacterium]|nr:acyl carrier protein [Gammaproteobacteria bacterium]